MKYIESALTKNEEILYRGKPCIFHAWKLIGIILGISLIMTIGVYNDPSIDSPIGFIFFMTIGASMWLGPPIAIFYYTTEMVITNKRVMAKSGFFNKSTVEIKLDKIESIRIEQNILGRFLNFGTVIVAGAGNPQAPIPGIKNPFGLRNAFVEIQESHK